MAKILCATVLAMLIACVSAKPSVLTGNVIITSGLASAGNQDASNFTISGQNFSVTDYTDVAFDQVVLQQHEIPVGSLGECAPQTGEYMGVEAACFAPLPSAVPSIQEVAGIPWGISFTPTGTPTPIVDGEETQPFTAIGQILGFTPADCSGGNHAPDCTQAWDVTFTGQGVMTTHVYGPFNYVEGIDLSFTSPESTPEPSTSLLFAGGILALTGYALRRKHRTTA